MNRHVLTFVIALITSFILTALLYSADVNQKLLITVAGVSFVVNGLIFWLVLEYIVLRDATQLKDLIGYYLRGKKIEDLPQQSFNLDISKHMFRDITLLINRKDKKISKLQEQADFRGQFIADVSHELKTPIFTAQGYVYTLLDGAVNDDEVRHKFLKKSVNSLDYLDKLVKDLLELSQIEIGSIVLIEDHFDLVKLIDEVIEDFERQANKANVTIARSKKPPTSIVYADYIRIRQVIQNLVSNALKYNVKGGKVTIKIVEEFERVEVEIKDTGIGIPREDINQIFNRFYRVDKSRTKIKNKGSNGLGLAIVKHILGKHKSTIAVKSEIGKGSVFSFSLWKDKSKFNGQRAKTEELDII